MATFRYVTYGALRAPVQGSGRATPAQGSAWLVTNASPGAIAVTMRCKNEASLPAPVSMVNTSGFDDRGSPHPKLVDTSMLTDCPTFMSSMVIVPTGGPDVSGPPRPGVLPMEIVESPVAVAFDCVVVGIA